MLTVIACQGEPGAAGEGLWGERHGARSELEEVAKG